MKDHHSDAFQVAEIGDGEQRSASGCRLVHLIPSSFSTTFAIIPTFMTAAFSCASVQPNFFVQYRTSASSKCSRAVRLAGLVLNSLQAQCPRETALSHSRALRHCPAYRVSAGW